MAKSNPQASTSEDEAISNKPLVFRPAARLQFLLSEELVSDPNVAVLEFVKNGYDADADDVLIHFGLGDSPADSWLIIADNGIGMDLSEFEKNWMHPGFSAKFQAKPTRRNRVQVGEKGLGRLAAGRLGATLDVYTRKRESDPWLHAFFRWEDFNRMDRLLDEIEVQWDTETEPPVEDLDHGTVIEINGLSLKWNSRPPGRRPKNRAATRLGRLRQDLEVLLVPLAATGKDFAIRLEHDSDLDEDETGPIEPPQLDLLEYEYHFAVRRTGAGWKIDRDVRRTAEVAEETRLPVSTRTTVLAKDLPEEIDVAAVGEFEGSMFYAPRSVKRFKQLRVPTGVRIYRDGVRIDPYGDPSDDWLGANERKAVRQGHAAIAPNALYGAVRISKQDNPDLKPLVNREGLIENPGVEAFLSLCRQEFAHFGDLIQEEFLDPKWDRQQAQKRSESAFESRQWAVAMTRATAHAVRQPIASAGTELSRIRNVVDGSTEVPEDLRQRLLELEDTTRLHLRRIDATVEKMLGFLEIDPEPKTVNLIELVGDVIDHVEPDATSAGVVINDETGVDPIDVIASPGLLEHAIEELLENAIRVPRPDGRVAEVAVRVEQTDGQVRVQVEDNGSGVPQDVQNLLFSQSVSRTGHVGVGLMFNRQLMQIALGDVRLVSTGATGSIFDVVVPA